MSVEEAYRLASEIEWAHAVAMAADKPRRRGDPPLKTLAAYHYDAHAATELAELILNRTSRPTPSPTHETGGGK